MDFALDGPPAAHAADEELVEAEFVEGVEAVDGLLETEGVFSGLERVAELIGEVVKVPPHRFLRFCRVDEGREASVHVKVQDSRKCALGEREVRPQAFHAEWRRGHTG